MIKLGQYNKLKINRFTDFGAYLGDESGDEVLMPKKWVPEKAMEEDSIEAFVYLDSEARPIATSQKPLAQVGEFANLCVKQVAKVGAFLDWGLEKDLLLPFSEQPEKVREGEYLVVYIYVDDVTSRITASARLKRFCQQKVEDLKENEAVKIIVYKSSDLGYQAVVNNKYLGLLYRNEVFERLTIGEEYTAYVKQVREDGKIDLVLQKPGYAHVEPNAEKVLTRLKDEGGFLALNDKSKPEEITAKLQMSKKTFKKAIGSLYKQRLISIENDGLRLL